MDDFKGLQLLIIPINYLVQYVYLSTTDTLLIRKNLFRIEVDVCLKMQLGQLGAKSSSAHLQRFLTFPTGQVRF